MPGNPLVRFDEGRVGRARRLPSLLLYRQLRWSARTSAGTARGFAPARTSRPREATPRRGQTAPRQSNLVLRRRSKCGIPAPPGGSPGTNGIFYFTDSSGNSVYHGLTFQVIEKAGKYFQLNANYTWSHTLDDGTFVTFVSTPQSNAQRGLERANSNQDARHRFVANFVADAPQQTFLRNFELSSIVTLQSARPFTLFVGFDANNDGNPVTDRVGSSSRNTYRCDNLQTVDLRLSRAIYLGERRKLNLSVDAFNLFNRKNVDEVFSVYGAPDFVGPVPRHFGDGVVGPSGAVGIPRTTFNPRQLQFAAKFTF